MSQFAFIYRRGTLELTPDQMREHLDECKAWFDELLADGYIKETGIPLGLKGAIVR